MIYGELQNLQSSIQFIVNFNKFLFRRKKITVGWILAKIVKLPRKGAPWQQPLPAFRSMLGWVLK